MKTSTMSLSSFLQHIDNVTALEHLIDILPKCSTEGPWLSGGSLHRTYRGISIENADLDFYFQDEKQLNCFLANVNKQAIDAKKYITKSYEVSKWHHSVTINYMNIDWKIQCISFLYFKSIEEMFNSFDINVCSLAYDGTNVHFAENVISDIKNNRLKFNDDAINYPNVTLKRLVKYLKMGYDVDESEIKKLCNSFTRANKHQRKIHDMDITSSPINSSISDYSNLKNP